ncbi:MAG: tetratricopeptide repeat protein [Candidatus Edwardsbacteria bacterium]|nr:tetratricopeptide repeat protein [Candidatus Edwardsbacteria bacterium]
MNVAFLTGCATGTPEQHLTAGGQAFLRGDTATAIKEYKVALRLDKRYAPAHYNLGICYSTPKTRDKAVEHFSRAIALDQHYIEAYVGLAQSYLRKDSLAGAVEVLQRGLGQGLPPEPFYANLGYAYLLTAQKDSALSYYRRAIACDSTRAEYWFNVGYLLTKPEQSGESIASLRQARRFSAEPASVSYLLGTRLLEKPGRTRAETAEGIALLEEYLASGDRDQMKTAKAREKIAPAARR